MKVDEREEEAVEMEGVSLDHDQGMVANIGAITMRLIVSKAQTNGAFAVAEFRGPAGPWTVPHMHREMEESFYVLEGGCSFTIGERDVDAKQGAFVMVPRGTPHLVSGGSGGGTLLTIFAPGGLEEMFLELGDLPAGSITDPQVRAEIAKRHDSVPV